MKTTKLGGDRWISLFQTEYTRPNGTLGSWTHVSRKETATLDCTDKFPDAVLIAAVLETPGFEPRFVLIAEHRIPLGGKELGFPAGLIDKNESANTAAIREFKEETGLELKVTASSPLNLFSTPGMTDESVIIVFGTASGIPSKEFLEPAENIEVHLVTKAEAKAILTNNKPFGCMGWSCKGWPILAAWCGAFDEIYK